MTEYWNKELLVLGCGNVLFGDDGFGPAVAEHLQYHCAIPANACVMDVGMGIRDVLLTLAMSESRPRMVIVVDAVDGGRPPGDILEYGPDEIADLGIGNQSRHLVPTSNLLRELSETCGVDVKIVSIQAERIPASVSVGLSVAVRDAIPRVCETILNALH